MGLDKPLSQIQEFAFKVLDCFDELAKPELNNRIIAKIWNYLKGYVAKIILTKPDEEIKLSLLKIYQALGPLFKDTEISIQAQIGEELGSIKIPRVGEFGKTVDLVKIHANKAEALKIIEELKHGIKV